MGKSGKKSNKGCLIAVLVTVSMMIIAIIAISNKVSSITSDKNVKIRHGAYVVIDTRGSLPYTDEDLFGRGGNTFRKIILALDAVSRDPDVEGIILKDASLPLSQAEEIGKILEKNKKNGKKILAYLSSIDKSGYYLASMADEIAMVPSESSFVDIKGYHYSNLFYKGLFDKIGVDFKVIHIGAYKGTGENYSEERMSSFLRENLTTFFDSIQDLFIAKVSAERGFDDGDFRRNMLAGGYFLISPEDCVKKGIIDTVMYEDEFYKKHGIEKKSRVSIFDYADSVRENMYRDKIALIYAEGTIVMGRSKRSFSPFSGYEKYLGEKTFVEQVRKAAEDEKIKGIVIRVDSPGGSALASNIMWKAVSDAADAKPLYVSFGRVAASGGYYISAPAKKIFSNLASISGSIGVVAMIPNYQALLSEKLNIRNEEISGGKYSGFGNPARKMTSEEARLMKASMTGTYEEFKTKVSLGRGMSMTEVERVAQGRVYAGLQAEKAGLVDEIGTLKDTIDAMKEELGVKNIMVTEYPKKKSFFEALKESMGSTRLRGISDYLMDNMETFRPLALFPYVIEE